MVTFEHEAVAESSMHLFAKRGDRKMILQGRFRSFYCSAEDLQNLALCTAILHERKARISNIFKTSAAAHRNKPVTLAQPSSG